MKLQVLEELLEESVTDYGSEDNIWINYFKWYFRRLAYFENKYMKVAGLVYIMIVCLVVAIKYSLLK